MGDEIVPALAGEEVAHLHQAHGIVGVVEAAGLPDLGHDMATKTSETSAASRKPGEAWRRSGRMRPAIVAPSDRRGAGSTQSEASSR